MSKLIILGGNARSGKTTLSNKLIENNFNYISFDELYDFMKECLNINVDKMNHEDKTKIFDYIFNRCIEKVNNNENYIIDMYDFLPKDLCKYQDVDNVEIYFLAYPNCTKEEIKYNVIHYAKPTDWIAQVNEDYLDECVERFDKRNKLLLEECGKYNMVLIDTKSGNNRNTVLNDLYDKIISSERRNIK